MEVTYTEESQAGKEGLFVTKVLGFTGLEVFFTAGIGWLYGRLLLKIFGDSTGMLSEEGYTFALVMMALSVVISIMVSIFGTSLAWKQNKTPIAPYLIYILVEGVFFGSVVAFGVSPLVIGTSLGLTSLVFLLCFGIGFLSKGRVKGARLALMIIGIGLLVHLLTFGIWFLFFPETLLLIYPLISILFFIIATLYIVIDANNVKNRIQDGAILDNRLALTCAFTLYADFMYLFWRIMRIVIVLFANKD